MSDQDPKPFIVTPYSMGDDRRDDLIATLERAGFDVEERGTLEPHGPTYNLEREGVTTWERDPDGFAEAVEADEYAELRLSTGDTLITDHESDGTFNPYVEMTGDHGDAHPTDILDSVASAIEDATGAHVHAIEYDTNNDVLVPDMDRPDTDA